MSPELTRFKSVMRQNNCFITKQRLALFKYLQASPAISINALINDLPNQDQATVYRNIKLFERIGIISRLQLGWNSKLELSNTFHDHHHHMSCVKCGKVVAWEEDPTIELRIQTVALKLGFIPQDHQLEIRGLCQSCQK
ncbi:transcriptional repressor [Candidatus Saccharibacteria bacterium]|nr:transcriptional repressor [Candidatus Saccharibacteria bacterium]